MSAINQWVKGGVININSRGFTERLLLFIALLLMTTFLWYSSLYQPRIKQGKAGLERIHALTQTIATLKTILAQAQVLRKRHPDQKIALETNQLKREESQLDEELAKFGIILAQPQELLRIERALIKRRGKLILYNVPIRLPQDDYFEE
jgi:hypothetical protein